MQGAGKGEWRAWARERRAQLPDVSGGVTAGLRAWLRERGVRRVLAYRAFGGESSVDGLADEFELFTTRARWRPEPHLTLHPWDSATVLSPQGILQPPPDAPRVAPELVEVVLVPGLAFDETGVRLGYGGGFYDRLLPRMRAALLGVAPEALVVRELPREAHDARVGFLATERGVRATRPG